MRVISILTSTSEESLKKVELSALLQNHFTRSLQLAYYRSRETWSLDFFHTAVLLGT